MIEPNGIPLAVWHLAQIAMFIVKANTAPKDQAKITLDSFLLQFQSTATPEKVQTWQEQKAIWNAWGKALSLTPKSKRKAPKG